jgi:methyltransferase (TIGR00027 family)
MSKTGDGESLGTAEGAVLGRASHALHAESPILADSWAVLLLGPTSQAQARDPAYAAGAVDREGFDPGPVLALNIGSLRYAEDEVESCVRDGIDQYVILGAGFDTFALRRDDLIDRVRVFEVDHPDVQALKRERIARADATPAALPTFVPVDFESTSLTEGLAATAFDRKRRSVFSWMNTIPYLSESATEATLRELVELAAPGSRLVLNYACDVAFTDQQLAYLKTLQGRVTQSGEPLQSRWKPQAFEELLEDVGFAILEHLTEQDLTARYFEGRADGLAPGIPARLVRAESRS